MPQPQFVYVRGKSYLAEFDSSGRPKIDFNRETPAFDLSGKRPSLSAPATIDEQGLLYMVAGDEILVVSESGEIVRELTPTKPSPEYTMTHIQAANGRLGVWFDKAEPHKPVNLRLALVDTTGGDILRLYEPERAGQ